MKKRIWTIALIVVGAILMYGSFFLKDRNEFGVIGNIGLIILIIGLYMIKSEKNKKRRIYNYSALYIIVLGLYNYIVFWMRLTGEYQVWYAWEWLVISFLGFLMGVLGIVI